jgi:putative ABC transport system ATP-binding protein
MELLTQLNKQGITVIVITHEAEVADYASRQIHFRDGRIESDHANPDVGKKRAHGG